jgi:type II secretory pathway component PulJ
MNPFPPAFRQKSSSGFTLIEVLVAFTIYLMVSIAAFSMFIIAAKVDRDIYNESVVDAESRTVENWLVSDLRSAITVETSYTYSGITYQSSNETLILRLPSIDLSGVPININTSTPSLTTSDVVVYYHDSSKQMHRLLVRNAASWRDGRNTASEDSLISKSTSPNLVFTSSFSAAPNILGPIVVHYEFQSIRKSYNGRSDYTVASAGSVYLRNRP